MSQWLPAYQVPKATTLAMIRAFVDVFPQAVLISGAEADLLLIGGNDPNNEIDPAQMASALSAAPAVRAICDGWTSGASARLLARSSARHRRLRRRRRTHHR